VAVSPVAVQQQGRSAPAVSEDTLGTVQGRPNALGQRFRELKAFFGVRPDEAARASALGLGELAGARRSLDHQIQAMAAELGGKTPSLEAVEHSGRLLLSRISEHMRKGRTDPRNARIRTSADEPALPVVDRTLRVGFYAVAGDPLQWGHILIALTAMAELQLDKVVFVLAGDDARKPDMTEADFRHPMGRAVLDTFSPLFDYSSIAVGTTLDGETNIMRMLQLNPGQSIHAFYIVGGDHYNLKDKKGNDDTLLKIQKKLETPGTLDPARHKVSLAFVERDGPLNPIPTPLDVHFLRGVGFDVSSTLVRQGQYDLMPWAAYEYVRENRPGLYGIRAKEPVAEGTRP